MDPLTTGQPEDDPQFDDLRIHLDHLVGYNPPRLATAEEIQAAQQRLDRWRVYRNQLSPAGFIAEWGVDPADVPLPYCPDGLVPAAGPLAETVRDLATTTQYSHGSLTEAGAVLLKHLQDEDAAAWTLRGIAGSSTPLGVVFAARSMVTVLGGES